jgi:phage/plasmid-associated DNA primase
MFNANQLPTCLEKSEAIVRKVDIFEFSRAVPPPAVQDVDLAQKLETELPGILN